MMAVPSVFGHMSGGANSHRPMSQGQSFILEQEEGTLGCLQISKIPRMQFINVMELGILQYPKIAKISFKLTVPAELVEFH